MSTIHEAAAAGDLAALDELLATDPASVHVLDRWGDTPLHHAASAEIADLLIQRGADVNARGWMGRIPLHEAAVHGRIAVIETMLRSGAEVNARRERGDTPLHVAADATVAQTLVSHGADLTARDEHGRTAMHWAAQFGRADVLRWLVAVGLDPNARANNGATPLHWAAQQGHLAAVNALIEAGADLNATLNANDNGWGDTSLHDAARRGQRDVVAALLTAGADPSIRNAGGLMPLHYAQRAKRSDLMEMLLHYTPAAGVEAEDPARPLFCEHVWAHRTRQEAVTAVRHAALARWVRAEDGSLREASALQFPFSRITAVAIAPASDEIVVITPEGGIELRRWNDLSLIQPVQIPEGDEFTSVAFSPDGRWLAIVDRERIHLVERSTGCITASVDGGERNLSLAFNPASTLLASACSFQGGGHVRLDRVTADGQLSSVAELDRSNYRTPPAEFVDTLAALAFSPDSRGLALFETSAIYHDDHPQGWRGNIVLYDVESASRRWLASVDARVTDDVRSLKQAHYPMGFYTDVLFVNDAEVACGATNGMLLFYDVATGNLTRRLKPHPTAAVCSLALHGSGDMLWAVLDNGELQCVPLGHGEAVIGGPGDRR